LSTLPWVETTSIRPDTDAEQVTFGFREKGAFSLEEVRTAIETKTPFRVGKVVKGP
jgi:hypothetical protein